MTQNEVDMNTNLFKTDKVALNNFVEMNWKEWLY